MKIVRVRCSKTACYISQDDVLLRSFDQPFSACAQEVFSTLHSLDGRVQLLLDEYVITKSTLSLEQVPEESKDGILRAQAAQIVGVPEDQVRYYFASMEDSGAILRGVLYCCDDRQLVSLVATFSAAHIAIDTISVPDHPEFVFFDRRDVLSRQMRGRRLTMAAVVLTLFCGLGTHLLQRAAETIAEYAQVKQLELSASRQECAMLKNRAFFKTKEKAFVVKAEQQRKRLSSFFAGISSVRPSGILPQQVVIDCDRAFVTIAGVARTSGAAPVYVERLRRNILSDASMTSLEHDRSSYRFHIEGVL